MNGEKEKRGDDDHNGGGGGDNNNNGVAPFGNNINSQILLFSSFFRKMITFSSMNNKEEEYLRSRKLHLSFYSFKMFQSCNFQFYLHEIKKPHTPHSSSSSSSLSTVDASTPLVDRIAGNEREGSNMRGGYANVGRSSSPTSSPLSSFEFSDRDIETLMFDDDEIIGENDDDVNGDDFNQRISSNNDSFDDNDFYAYYDQTQRQSNDHKGGKGKKQTKSSISPSLMNTHQPYSKYEERIAAQIGNMQIVGMIDELKCDKNGDITLISHSRNSRNLNQKREKMFVLMTLFEFESQKRPRGMIRASDMGPMNLTLTDEIYLKNVKLFGDFEFQVRKNVFNPSPSKFKCSHCSYSEICPFAILY